MIPQRPRRTGPPTAPWRHCAGPSRANPDRAPSFTKGPFPRRCVGRLVRSSVAKTPTPTPTRGESGGGDSASTIQAIKTLLADSAFINKSEKEIQAGFDLWFGNRKGDAADVDVTKKKQAAGEVYGGFGAAVTGRAAHGSAVHEIPFGLTVEQYHALAQASAIIGVRGDAKGQLRAKLGTKAYTGLKGAVSGFAGAKASAQASGKISMVKGSWYPVGAELSGSASAFAGAQSNGSATFTLAMNPAEWAGIGADIGVAYDAKAGAWADAAGEFVIDPLRGVVLSGSASAFAGVSAEVEVSGSAKLYGRKAFTVSTSVSGSAGVGGKASGGFSLTGGRLTLKGNAEAAMGPGMGGGFGLEADFKPMAVMIYREIAKASWKALARTDGGVSKKTANDFDLAKDALDKNARPRLVKYRDWKLSQLGANLSSEYVKMENVQLIIDENWPRALVKGDGKDVDRIDKYIQDMLEEIFGSDVPYEVYDSSSKSNIKSTVGAQAKVVRGVVKVLQWTPRDIASILAGTVAGKHNKGGNANALYSPHGLAQG